MSKVDFEGQREGEEVELVFRQHIMTAWKGLMFLVVMTVLGMIPMLIWRERQELFFVWLGFFLVGVLGALRWYILWHYSYYLVTNERIRQVRQKGFFRKTVVDLGLDKIQSLSYEVPGILGGMFGYGTLLLQTQVGNMRISMVSQPEKTYNILQDLVDRAQK